MFTSLAKKMTTMIIQLREHSCRVTAFNGTFFLTRKQSLAILELFKFAPEPCGLV